MKDDYASLPYRDNVSCIVFKGKRFLLVQRQGWEKNLWKFPQGGIDNGETLADAAIRELTEELGTKNFTILGTSSQKLQYDWDDTSIELAKCRWRGQNQRYVIARYEGKKNEISCSQEEIKDSKWVTRDRLQKYIYHELPAFRGYWETIEKVLTEFDYILNL